MTKTQRAKQESYTRINDSISNNAVIATALLGLEEEVDDLEATILIIINASTSQIAEPVGLTNSETKKLLMADSVVKYILRAKVKSKRLGLLTIANQLDETHTFYLKGAKVEIISKAKAARNILNDS